MLCQYCYSLAEALVVDRYLQGKQLRKGRHLHPFRNRFQIIIIENTTTTISFGLLTSVPSRQWLFHHCVFMSTKRWFVSLSINGQTFDCTMKVGSTVQFFSFITFSLRNLVGIHAEFSTIICTKQILRHTGLILD